MKHKLIALALSLLLLAAIYYKIDPRRFLSVFRTCDFGYLALSLSLVIPLTLLTAWRLQILAPASTGLGFAECNRLILVASVLNLVLPSKMGDVAKAYFMKNERVSSSLTLALVVFEKSADLLSLLFWCAFGLVLYPVKDFAFWLVTAAIVFGCCTGLAVLFSAKVAGFFFSLGTTVIPGLTSKLKRLEASWRELQEFLHSHPRRAAEVASLSIFLWFLHLVQIWLFILALRAFVPFTTNLGLAPLALLAGLLPLTFAGIGTRDAALIFLYRPYFDPPVAAALGLLCTARYFIPALAGLIPLPRYLGKLRHAPA